MKNNLKINSDYSNYNFIYGNNFNFAQKRGYGIVIQGDDNLVMANDLKSSHNGSTFIRVGSKSRKLYDPRGKTKGNSIYNNTFDGEDYPIRAIWHAKGMACNNHIVSNGQHKTDDRICTDLHFSRSEAFNYWSTRYSHMKALLRTR